MVKNWTALNIETGTSTDWYLTGEYVIPELSYITPFARYESRNRFDGADGYEVTSTLVSINWYLRGNTIKAGFVYQKDAHGIYTGNKDVSSFRITSQWFF